jgi:hypothetical protein
MGFEHPEWPLDLEKSSVTITRDVERLFVVRWVAGLFIVALTLSFAMAWWAERTSRTMRDYDVDLPSNMMDYYGILHSCKDLDSMAGDVEKTNYEGRFVDQAKSRWNLETANFWIEKDHSARRLRVEGLRRT